MIKRIVSVLVAAVMLFSVLGCTKNGDESVDTKDTNLEEYKGLIVDFLDALVADDYSKAASYLYVEASDSFEEYCKKVETDYDFKYADGYDIRRYTEEYYADGNDTVKGTVYVYDLHVNFGDSKCYALFQIADDGEKVGILTFEFGSRAV